MATREAETPEEMEDMTSLWPVVDGMFFPPNPLGRSLLWKEHISSLNHLTLRDDDVFICAYPKAGTHWLWEVVSMLKLGKIEYETRPKEQLMMDYVDVKKLDEMPSPRILNTHLPFSMLPVPEMKARRIKVVHVYRNPKDCAVSNYHLLRNRPYGVTDFETFFEVFFSKKAMFGLYFDYLRQMHEFTEKNSDVPVLSISYEDMKKTPREKVKEVARFLEMKVTVTLSEEVEVACRFDNMKKQVVDKAAPVLGDSSSEASDLPERRVKPIGDGRANLIVFRKGEVGDWKNYLTVAMSEKVDQLVKEKMEGLPFILQFS